MNQQNILCLVIDGLRASALGTYGAAACETTALDKLASQSFVFDQAWIDSPELAALYRGYWQALPACLPDSAAVSPASLPGWLAQRHYQTLLVTDDPEIAEHTLAHEFEAVHLLPPGEQRSSQEIEQTQFARIFAETIESIESLSSADQEAPFLMWVHAQGMFAPWDGPQEFRQSLADEEDPIPPDFTAVPKLLLPADYDPDELLGISQAYAGQVMTLDFCLAALLEYLDQQDLRENTTVMLLGGRGFPLGEHRRVGLEDKSLYGELLHVPLLCRLANQAHAGFRSSALTQPWDIPNSVAEIIAANDNEPSNPVPTEWRGTSWLPLVRGETEAFREAILMQNASGDQAIRTGAWHMRKTAKDSGELFVKPDDRWEANEISSLCPEIVDDLLTAASAVEASMESNTPAPPALQPHLTNS